MKRFLVLALAVGLIFGVADMSMAAWPSDPGGIPAGNVAAGGIAGSRHNLGSYSQHVVSPNTSEICIFCHTPHHGGTNGPLWNRGYGSGYTAYGTTIAGTSVGAPGGATLACLSCHDGVTQFDVIVNAPGKGNQGLDSTAAHDLGWTFSDEGIVPVNSMAFTPRANIGTNLQNDHPVSVPYTDTKASLRPTSTVIANIDLTSGLASSVATDTNLSQNRWAINGFIDNGTAKIADLLRNGKVECSSCHDPHFSNKSLTEAEQTWGGEAGSDGTFLRRVGGNAGSGVCRTCHNK